jgi:hypothetical protein
MRIEQKGLMVFEWSIDCSITHRKVLATRCHQNRSSFSDARFCRVLHAVDVSGNERACQHWALAHHFLCSSPPWIVHEIHIGRVTEKDSCTVWALVGGGGWVGGWVVMW